MTGRWTYRVSAAGVLVLAAAAFTLSYDALHQLALDSRVRPALAWLWPVVIDGTIVVALLTVLAAKRAAARAGYPWTLAGLFSAASVAFNIAHAPDRPAAPAPAPPHRPGDHPAPEPPSPDQPTPAGARARVREAYEAQIQAGQTPTGAGLARAAGVSERYGQRLLAEFTTDPARPGHRNGNRPAEGHPAHPDAQGR